MRRFSTATSPASVRISVPGAKQRRPADVDEEPELDPDPAPVPNPSEPDATVESVLSPAEFDPLDAPSSIPQSARPRPIRSRRIHSPRSMHLQSSTEPKNPIRSQRLTRFPQNPCHLQNRTRFRQNLNRCQNPIRWRRSFRCSSDPDQLASTARRRSTCTKSRTMPADALPLSVQMPEMMALMFIASGGIARAEQ